MRRIFMWVLVFISTSMSHPALAKEKIINPVSITFGIVPQQSASKLARLWSPFLAYLSKETGLKIVFRTAKDIPTFEKRLNSGLYDIAYMNPYHYTVFHESRGYQAFARAKDKKIKGILVRKKDGGISDISQLNGSTLAFPAPAAFAASILIRAYLQNQGIDFTPKYVSSHDSVYRTVASGLYPAGGGVIRTFENMDSKVGDMLSILWESPGYTPHAFAAHPDLDKVKLAEIKKVMLEMEQTEEGSNLLASLNLKGLVSAENTDWDDIRALHLEQLFEK